MSYGALEQSVEDGRPVELYLFQNVTHRFAYASGSEAITYAGNTYLPRPVAHTSPSRGGSLQSSDSVVVTLPADDAFARRYVNGVPSSPDRLTIYRRHLTDGAAETVFYWSGEVDSVAFKANEAKVLVLPAMGSALLRTIPKRTYRSLCNHVLYDRGCKVNDTSFRFVVTVQTISADGTLLTVSGAGISGLGAGYFDAGFLRRDDIDHRMVLSSEDLGGNQLSVGVLLPFEELAFGDELELFAGCDHTIQTCNTKFANEVNFGGFPYVPTKNPFETGILDS